MRIYKGDCDSDMRFLLGVDPKDVEWITQQEYLDAPTDEVQALADNYRLFWCQDEDDKLFLIPREEEDVDDNRDTV